MKRLFPHGIPAAVCLLAMFLVCPSCLGKKQIVYQNLTTAVVRQRAPQVMAVLPFADVTGQQEENLGELVRESVYSHLSVRPYRDVELNVVDARLGSTDVAGIRLWTPQRIVDLGRRIGADALVFGKVTAFDRLFTGIYSQLSIGADLTIFDARTGEAIWQDHHDTRFHEGGVPLNLFSIPFISIRSGMNLSESSQIRAIDELARTLVTKIPYAEAGDAGQAERYEVQAGSFLDERHAEELVEKLRDGGDAAFIRTRQAGAQRWHRVLLGPYEDREEAERVREKVRETTGAKAFIGSVTAAGPPAAAPTP